jgi:hypothetical protein
MVSLSVAFWARTSLLLTTDQPIDLFVHRSSASCHINYYRLRCMSISLKLRSQPQTLRSNQRLSFSLWASLQNLAGCPLSSRSTGPFQHTRLQPLLDQADDPSIADTVLDAWEQQKLAECGCIRRCSAYQNHYIGGAMIHRRLKLGILMRPNYSLECSK